MKKSAIFCELVKKLFCRSFKYNVHYTVGSHLSGHLCSQADSLDNWIDESLSIYIIIIGYQTCVRISE